jgi:hypothetical protein
MYFCRRSFLQPFFHHWLNGCQGVTCWSRYTISSASPTRSCDTLGPLPCSSLPWLHFGQSESSGAESFAASRGRARVPPSSPPVGAPGPARAGATKRRAGCPACHSRGSWPSLLQSAVLATARAAGTAARACLRVSAPRRAARAGPVLPPAPRCAQPPVSAWAALARGTCLTEAQAVSGACCPRAVQ